MRIARVIGKVTLNRQMSELAAGRYLVVRPLDRTSLAGDCRGGEESIVIFDELSAAAGDLVGVSEGREATAPFWPKKVPYDSYNAAILDEVDFTAAIEPAKGSET